MLKLNRGDQAKQCFMEALALDVKCYEAFEQLVSGEMITPDEGMFPPFFARREFAHCCRCRMGVRTTSSVPRTNARRRGLRAAGIPVTTTEVQTHG